MESLAQGEFVARKIDELLETKSAMYHPYLKVVLLGSAHYKHFLHWHYQTYGPASDQHGRVFLDEVEVLFAPGPPERIALYYNL